MNSPTSVTVPAGTSSLSFTVNSRAVSTINAGTYTASYGGTSKTLNLSVRPIYVQSLVLTPSSVVGGNPVSGVATTECAAPSGGMTVALSSTNTAVAAPTTSSIVVAAGATKGTFTVRTTRPAATTTVTIKASAHAVTKNAVLTVTQVTGGFRDPGGSGFRVGVRVPGFGIRVRGWDSACGLTGTRNLPPHVLTSLFISRSREAAGSLVRPV